jgi:DNA-binding MurR/RpiR family transcriptional regulator
MARKIAEYSAAYNYTIREIAESLGVSKSTVQRIMKEY